MKLALLFYCGLLPVKAAGEWKARGLMTYATKACNYALVATLQWDVAVLLLRHGIYFVL